MYYARHILQCFKLTIVIMAILLFVRSLLVDVFWIPSESMSPTLPVGSVVYVNKWIYGGAFHNWKFPAMSKPHKGELIAFYLPTDYYKQLRKRSRYVKRCAAMPGEKVYHHQQRWMLPTDSSFRDTTHIFRIPTKGEIIKINAQNIGFYKPLLAHFEGAALTMLGAKVFIDGQLKDNYTIQHDYYYCLGDNASVSDDSRYWGLLPDTYLIGKVFYY